MSSDEEARDIASRKLIDIYDRAPNGSEKEIEAILALGGTGNKLAVEKLKDIYDRAPNGSEKEQAAIRALGKIGRQS